MTDVRRTRQVLDLALRVGEIMMGNGASGADVASTMSWIAEHYGLRHAQTDVMFTSLAMSHQAATEDESVVLMRQVEVRTLDHGDLTRVYRLVMDIHENGVELADARARVAHIAAASPTTHRWLITAAWGAMCAGVAFMLGADLRVMVLATVTGMLIDRVNLRLGKRNLPAFYLQVTGGLIATGTAIAAVASGLDIDPSLAVSSNILMLLAGVGFVGAIHDALSGYFVTAAARMIEAVLATAGIIAGVSGGLAVARVMGVEIGRLIPGRSLTPDATLAAVLLGAGIAAAAYAIACYAPPRAAVVIFLLGGAGFGVTQFLFTVGFGRAWSVGVAALGIGLAAHSAAKWAKVPVLVVVINASVPLLPGLSVYRGLTLLGEEEDMSTRGIITLMTALAIAIALAAGLILGEHLVTPLAPGARRFTAPMFTALSGVSHAAAARSRGIVAPVKRLDPRRREDHEP